MNGKEDKKNSLSRLYYEKYENFSWELLNVKFIGRGKEEK